MAVLLVGTVAMPLASRTVLMRHLVGNYPGSVNRAFAMDAFRWFLHAPPPAPLMEDFVLTAFMDHILSSLGAGHARDAFCAMARFAAAAESEAFFRSVSARVPHLIITHADAEFLRGLTPERRAFVLAYWPQLRGDPGPPDPRGL